MSRHEGVSCDSCLKSNFRGRRYKCLICYDYDLCATCYEEGATTTRHSTDHPMQCILTQSDFELYYGGEVLPADQPQSFTCPYCKRMGLSDSALLEHVSAEHTDTGLEVVCPVCAALPGGEPNFIDVCAVHDEPSAIRHGGVRRMPHSGRALGGPRSRRSNMHFSSSGGGLSTLSPSGRESVDPIAELLQQLSNVRRGGAPQPSQLQQLQMQIQLERQQVTAARQQLERLPRRQQQPAVVSSAPNATGVNNNAIGATQANPNHTIITLNAGGRDGPIAASSSLPMVSTGVGVCNVPGSVGSASGAGSSAQQSQFLMARFMVPTMDDAEQTQLGRDRADRSQFVQALMLSTIANVQPFNKSADEELSDELSSMNLGVGGNTCSTVNSSVKRPASDDGGETGELLQDGSGSVGGATDSNYGKEDGNCDSFKLGGADSANGGSNEDSPNMMHPSAQHPLGHRGGGGHGGSGKAKGGSSTKSGTGGGVGGPVERRASRQTPPSGGGVGNNAAKARELKQANSSSNTSTSVSSRQQHHVPDSRYSYRVRQGALQLSYDEIMDPQSIAQEDWNERFDTAGESVFSGNGDVYRRFQDIDGGSNSSASNDTESTTLLDETCRKSERLYDITPMDRGDRHNRGSTKKKKFLWIVAFCLIGMLVMSIMPNNNDRGRVGTIVGWGLNTSRETTDYVLPYENTTVIDPLNVCTNEERSGLVEESKKVYLLIVVCSSAQNFEARQAIRESWGKTQDFNYNRFQPLHERRRGEYLDPKTTVGRDLKEYMWLVTDDGESLLPVTEANNVHSKSNASHSERNESSIAGMVFNVKLVFLVGQSEADYVHQRQRSAIPSAGDGESSVKRSAIVQPVPTLPGTVASLPGLDPSRNPSAVGTGTPRIPLFPSGADVDPAFNTASNEMDELQRRIVNESEVYGDIIQESFIDSYNNLTLKTIMMLKWVTNNCDGKEPQEEDRRPANDRKQYLLFKLETREYSGDIEAKLMVYVHGDEWLKNNLRPEMAGKMEQEVIFTVGKTGKAGAVIEHARKKIPKGAGQFVQFNVTDLVLEWFKERELGTARTSKYIVVETLNDLARKLVVNIKYIMKCDDDTFVNVPNLLHVLLGGTVPLYKAAISFYDTNTVAVKSPKNRLTVGKHLLTGFLFCDAKPIGDTSSKWYSPTYMYDKEVYPNYLSGTAYLMNFETAKLLYRASLSTPIFHLEDVYLTGIVANRVKIRRRHHPLFFYSYTKDLCALRGMISQHQLQPGEIRTAYDYITNSSILCNGPEKRFTVGQLKLQQRKKCQ
uniref:ZZ-type domain-containing protein n=1 Tax=Anopheles minimus TaxID=112268 RepID=A0A182VZX8_9DIPT